EKKNRLEGMVLKTHIEKNDQGEDEYFVSGIASSSIKDRHGDTILPTALIDMERDANNNLTMFLNHKAEVPEGIAGSVMKASIASRANDADGSPLYDLDFEKVRIDKTNDRAVKTWKSMHGGTKLGMSIGARIPEGGAVRNKKTGALLIAHVELLETSFVGIPANPRSWVDYATKALNSEIVTKAAIPEVDVDDKDPKAVAAAVAAVLEKDKAPEPKPLPPEPPTVPEPPKKADEPDITAATAPSQGAPESGPGADGATTPDVTAAAAPETPATPDLSKATTPELVAALVEAQGALATMSSKYVDLVQQLAATEQRAVTAEQERDLVAKTARGVVLDAAQIVKRLERLPVGQRASFKQIKSDFEDGLPAGLDGIYTESFLRQLRGDAT
ncbi:MAG TPA: hypothetical protein VFP22_02190, partial [Candidatus Limnocylindrales bacterium]|nr:hypothetical protein [Candidatus Limnocylindrales bacterium]